MGEMSDKPVHPYLDQWCMTRPIEGMAKREEFFSLDIPAAAAVQDASGLQEKEERGS